MMMVSVMIRRMMMMMVVMEMLSCACHLSKVTKTLISMSTAGIECQTFDCDFGEEKDLQK